MSGKDNPKRQAARHLAEGVRLTRREEWEAAIGSFVRAVTIRPDYAEAYCNLGWVFHQLEQFDKAEAFLRQAIELKADANAYNNLALVFAAVNRRQDAEVCLREAIRLAPRRPEIYNNLGSLLEDGYRLEEAEAAYRQAVALNARYAEAYYNLGNFLRVKQQFAEAEHYLEQALQIRPDFYQAALGLAFLHLQQGRFAQGWRQYAEFQRSCADGKAGKIRRWFGEDLTGCRILLYYANGLGDTLHFVRYAALVAGTAKEVVVWVQEPLQALIAVSFPQLAIHAGITPPAAPFDFACSLPNLPMVFATDESSIPSGASYIQPDAAVTAYWRDRLECFSAPGVSRAGVVWAGNPKHHQDRHRSIPYAVFSELFTRDGWQWISLQVGERAGDLAAKRMPVVNLAAELSDYSQTAGVIANLELVITVDSSVAHLAGAMGKPVWILLAADCDWRWQLERADSPWYDSARLFRQRQFGHWPEVIADVKQALAVRAWSSKTLAQHAILQ